MVRHRRELADTVSLTIAAGRADTVEFDDWDALELGTFPVACSTMLAGDANAGNDVVRDSVAVVLFTGVREQSDPPTALSFDGVAPNRTGGRAAIRYGLPGPTEVRIAVHSTAGTRVRILQSRTQSAGYHGASWDGRDEQGRMVGAGVYLVRIEAGRFSATRKLVVRSQ